MRLVVEGTLNHCSKEKLHPPRRTPASVPDAAQLVEELYWTRADLRVEKAEAERLKSVTTGPSWGLEGTAIAWCTGGGKERLYVVRAAATIISDDARKGKASSKHNHSRLYLLDVGARHSNKSHGPTCFINDHCPKAKCSPEQFDDPDNHAIDLATFLPCTPPPHSDVAERRDATNH